MSTCGFLHIQAHQLSEPPVRACPGGPGSGWVRRAWMLAASGTPSSVYRASACASGGGPGRGRRARGGAAEAVVGAGLLVLVADLAGQVERGGVLGGLAGCPAASRTSPRPLSASASPAGADLPEQGQGLLVGGGGLLVAALAQATVAEVDQALASPLRWPSLAGQRQGLLELAGGAAGTGPAAARSGRGCSARGPRRLRRRSPGTAPAPAGSGGGLLAAALRTVDAAEVAARWLRQPVAGLAEQDDLPLVIWRPAGSGPAGGRHGRGCSARGPAPSGRRSAGTGQRLLEMSAACR